METLYHIRRGLLEIGAFSAAQIAGLRRTGALNDRDYVRPEFGQYWLPLPLWIRSLPSAGSKRGTTGGKVGSAVRMIALVLFMTGAARAETADADHHLATLRVPQADQFEPKPIRGFSLGLGLLAVGAFFQRAIFRTRRQQRRHRFSQGLQSAPPPGHGETGTEW